MNDIFTAIGAPTKNWASADSFPEIYGVILYYGSGWMKDVANLCLAELARTFSLEEDCRKARLGVWLGGGGGDEVMLNVLGCRLTY